MARSNIGGTRGFLRGRVANDLYQVTRDEAGKRIQLVRSVEESRINNNTMPQAMARMQMALCMGSLAQFKEIVDHSFEGFPYGQLSIAHFVHLNIPLIQNDCKNHWSDMFLFNYPEKGVSVPKAGSWIMAEGSLVMPDFITCHSTSIYGENSGVQLAFDIATLTKGDMKQKLSLADNDYITHLCFAEGVIESFNKLCFLRLYLNPAFDDSTVITAQNYQDVFTYSANAPYRSSFDASTGTFFFYFDQTDLTNIDAFSVSTNVISRWDGRVWGRNNARFMPVPGYEDYTSNWISPHDRFQSWFPAYDPDESDEYPLPTEDWVDLGLPSGTLWRKFNIGATSPLQFGLFFTYANLQGHYWNGNSFSDGYIFSEANYSTTPGASFSGNIDDAHDAAREYLGEHWKLPTNVQLSELINNTTQEFLFHGTLQYVRFTSNNNSESLLFPLTGFGVNSTLYSLNQRSYLASGIQRSNTQGYIMSIDSNSGITNTVLYKWYGFQIRPVYVP